VRRPGLVIFPATQIAGLATNNVLRSPARQADAALEVRSDLRAFTDWCRHALEFRAVGAAAFSPGIRARTTGAYALEARGRLDIGPAHQSGGARLAPAREDTRSAPNAPLAAAERGDLEVDRAAVTFNHRFNRLAFQLRGAIREFDFAPVPSLAGTSISNDARDLLARDCGVPHHLGFRGRVRCVFGDRHRRPQLSHASRGRLVALFDGQLGLEVRHAFQRYLIGERGGAPGEIGIDQDAIELRQRGLIWPLDPQPRLTSPRIMLLKGAKARPAPVLLARYSRPGVALANNVAKLYAQT
jgi:hypothetical protein